MQFFKHYNTSQSSARIYKRCQRAEDDIYKVRHSGEVCDNTADRKSRDRGGGEEGEHAQSLGNSALYDSRRKPEGV